MNCFQQILKYEKLLFSKISRRNANIQPTIRWNDLFLRNIRFQIRSSIGKKGSRYYQRGEECYCLFSSTCNSFFFCRGFFLSFSRITWKSGYIEFPCPFKCQLAGGRGFATFQLKWIPTKQTRKTNHSSIPDTSLIISEASESLVYTIFFFFPLILMSHRQDH